MQEVAGLLLVAVVGGLVVDQPQAVVAGVMVVAAWELLRLVGVA